jgi:hypothetical protein
MAARDDLLDEVDTVLEGWAGCIRGELEWYREHSEKDWSSLPALSEKALPMIPPLRLMCRSAPQRTLQAVRSALWLGLYVGLSQAVPTEIHSPLRQRLRRAVSQGGKERSRTFAERRKRAEDRVAELQRENPSWTWSHTCKQAGRELGIPGRSVQRYTEHLKALGSVRSGELQG